MKAQRHDNRVVASPPHKVSSFYNELTNFLPYPLNLFCFNWWINAQTTFFKKNLSFYDLIIIRKRLKV